MICRRNIASWERWARVLGGALLIGCGALGVAPGALGTGLIVIGALMVLTGGAGSCPAYAAVGRTLTGK